MSDYTLTLTQRQLETLQEALDTYSRLGIGQWRQAFERLPLRQKDPSFNWAHWHDFLDDVGFQIRGFTKQRVDGYQSSLGIHSREISESAQIAWDLHQTIRNRLSWDRAIEQGIVESLDSPRNWREMMGVSYDEPLPTSDQPLAKLERLS